MAIHIIDPVFIARDHFIALKYVCSGDTIIAHDENMKIQIQVALDYLEKRRVMVDVQAYTYNYAWVIAGPHRGSRAIVHHVFDGQVYAHLDWGRERAWLLPEEIQYDARAGNSLVCFEDVSRESVADRQKLKNVIEQMRLCLRGVTFLVSSVLIWIKRY